MERSLALLNLVDSSLTSLGRKGNLLHAESLYNPGGYFRAVHHVSFGLDDAGVCLADPTIHVHVLRPFPLVQRIRVVRGLLNLAAYVAQVIRIGRRERIDVIRSRSVYTGGVVGLLASRLTGIPLVVSLGGNNRLAQELSGVYYLANHRRLSFKLEELVLRGAHVVICPNRYTERYVIGLGVRPQRTCVIPMRLPEEFFDRSAPSAAVLLAHGVDLARPIVLYVGRLELDKQVELLVDAARQVADKVPEAQFVFVGDGSLRPQLERKAQELGVEVQCRFLGFQSAACVRAFLARASVVWIPMSGWVIYEAASQARPIVAFDVEWHPEFVENGVTGLLVENRNVRGLSDAVMRVLGDAELAAALGRAARARLDADFDPRRLVAREQDAYDRVLAASGHGR